MGLTSYWEQGTDLSARLGCKEAECTNLTPSTLAGDRELLALPSQPRQKALQASPESHDKARRQSRRKQCENACPHLSPLVPWKEGFAFPFLRPLRGFVELCTRFFANFCEETRAI